MKSNERASSSRKSFIAAASAIGAAIAVPASAQTSSPEASPSTAPTPSPAASDLAQRMRAYDSTLTDAQIADIAKQIDDNNTFARMIRKSYPLHNSEEPTPEFRVDA